MAAAQMLTLLALVLVAAMTASVFFGRRRRARGEINNEVGLFEELRLFIVTSEFTAAYIHAFRTGTPISRVVAAGLEQFDTGKAAVFSAMYQAIDDEQARWRSALFRLSACGAVASAVGLIGVALGVLRALNAPGSSAALIWAGANVAISIAISLFAYAGHGALTRMMWQSRDWLETTATAMLENAARVAVLSTSISSAALPEPRPVVTRGRS